jgi:Uma2 family endonuclease
VDWQITEDTIVQPDVLVVCGNVKRLKGKKLKIPPAIVFEILSPSTTRKDRIIKYRLYQEAGVKYYCIVDPETRSAEVYELQDAAYKKKDNFKDGKIHFDVDPCGIDFDFSEIFKG